MSEVTRQTMSYDYKPTHLRMEQWHSPIHESINHHKRRLQTNSEALIELRYNLLQREKRARRQSEKWQRRTALVKYLITLIRYGRT